MFFAGWLIAGALQPGYSAADSFISELAAKDASHPWLVIAGLAANGLSLLALAGGIRLALPRARLAVALFAVAALGLVAAAVLRLDCSATASAACEAAVRSGGVSWTHLAHLWAGDLAQLALVLTPFALARALWSRPAGVLALAAGVAGVLIAIVLAALSWDLGEGAGYAQRLGTLVVLQWVAIVAAGLLTAARRRAGVLPLTPMRAGRFFQRHWTGGGELVLRPLWLWRRFPMRFTAVRELDFYSDELFVFHDRAEFERGYVHDERRYCRMRGDDRIEVAAPDLPDGAVVRLEEDGYRIEPYTLLARAGPVALTLETLDTHRIDGETLIDTIDLRWLGILVGRMMIRMDPTSPA
jgi:hypothetical protein